MLSNTEHRIATFPIDQRVNNNIVSCIYTAAMKSWLVIWCRYLLSQLAFEFEVNFTQIYVTSACQKHTSKYLLKGSDMLVHCKCKNGGECYLGTSIPLCSQRVCWVCSEDAIEDTTLAGMLSILVSTASYLQISESLLKLWMVKRFIP